MKGRQEEQKVLDRLLNSQKPEFLALYGRRRVGKTFLIRSFFQKKSSIFFNATGVHHESLSRQLIEFTKEVSRVFYQGIELKAKENWFDTFELLTDSIQKQVPKGRKVVLFFDEFPWMATPRSKLLQALDYYWNRFWSQDSRIKLIICGSAASWIIRNIVQNKKGLHNRLTHTIRLDPMNLKEVKSLLQGMGIKLNDRHLTQIYMMTGGIPYYLTQVPSSGLSSSQIIEKMAFSKNAPLLEEFDKLFSSLFENAEIYIEIIRTIAKSRSGLSQDELFQKTSIPKGGTALRKLSELEEAGFIISFKPFGHKKKGIYYKVIDEYTLFYLYWIEPIRETLLKKGLRTGYWDKMMQSPSWKSWAGYAFEAICYKHLNQISASFNLSPTAIPNTWRYQTKKGSKEQGAQIDLLFDRDDDAITLCEIKYTLSPFIIDKSYAENIRRKIEIFKTKTGTTKQVFFSFISATGLKKTLYSEEMIEGCITLSDLF